MELTDPQSPWFPYVWVDPERMGGEPCFRDSRVPITALFDYLEAGETIDEFSKTSRRSRATRSRACSDSVSAAPPGLRCVWARDPGLRSRTRFTLGY